MNTEMEDINNKTADARISAKENLHGDTSSSAINRANIGGNITAINRGDTDGYNTSSSDTSEENLPMFYGMNPEKIEEYQDFAKAQLGFEFHDIGLLVTALTHRSYVNEHRLSAGDHNERLEFLGDAILELVTSDFLYHTYDEPEGVMTAWRSALVRTESLYEASQVLGYEPLVRLSHGERRGTDRAHAVILADCFEAIIGATYLDQGYHTAKGLIEKHILSKIDKIIEEGTWRDAKTHLQEICQHYETMTPQYRTLREEGPDHNKMFSVGVYVGRYLKGAGTGHSKQEAQTEAAIKAIKSYEAEYPELKYQPALSKNMQPNYVAPISNEPHVNHIKNLSTLLKSQDFSSPTPKNP